MAISFKDEVSGLKNKLSRTEENYKDLSAELMSVNKKFTACVQEQAESRSQLENLKNEVYIVCFLFDYRLFF